MTQHTRPAAQRHALFSIITITLAAASALGQLVPDRLYYGVDRKVPMTVNAEDGDVEIKLYDPATREVTAQAPAVAGGVDLASLFPSLWEEKSPDARYAQLFVNGNAVGAPVTIVPMISVDKATLINPQTMQPCQPGERGVPYFDSDFSQARGRERPITYSGLKAYVTQDVLIETSVGDIRVRMRPDMAPNHVWNFRELVDGGFYTDIIFHRILPRFVAQVGDPAGKGSGGPGHQIDLEKSTLPHDFGVVSMARTNNPDTGGSQIFICLTREATAQLDGSYTAFGQAIDGADTIKTLGETELADPRAGRPVDPPVLERASLVDAAPITQWKPPVAAPAAAEPTPVDTER